MIKGVCPWTALRPGTVPKEFQAHCSKWGAIRDLGVGVLASRTFGADQNTVEPRHNEIEKSSNSFRYVKYSVIAKIR